MQDVRFIFNPYSSKGNYQSIMEAILERIPDAKCYVSQSLQATFDYMDKEWNDTEVFVAVGGDGTISSVASKLIGSSKILAIFPAGSGNGFAKENGFDKNIDHLLSKLKNRHFRTLDTFRINNLLSINISGVGFDAAVVRDFEKTSRGLSNYVKVSLKVFQKFKPFKVEFKSKELEYYNGEYFMMNVANTRQFGNDAFIAPHALVDDGLMDVVLVKKFPFLYGLKFAFRMFNKTLKPDSYVKFFKVADLHLEVSITDWHIDGEYKTIDSPVHICVNPNSLKVLV